MRAETLFFIVLALYLTSCDRVDPYPPSAFEIDKEVITNGIFSICEPEEIKIGSASSSFIEVHGTIENISGNNLNIKWQKTSLIAPIDWDYSICDPEICYLPLIESATFILLTDSSGLMDMRFYPANTTGLGKGAIQIWQVGDSANTVLEMKFEARAE